MSDARALLALVERGWAALTPEEQELFESWPLNNNGHAFYTLLRLGRRRWSGSGTSTTLPAMSKGDDDE